MKWPFGRTTGPSPEALAQQKRSEEALARSHALRIEATKVGNSLRESRMRNHFAEGFREAMGGSPS